MRVLEILLAMAAGVLWCRLLWRPARARRAWPFWVPPGLLVAHVLVEGWRTEMVPVYAATVALAAAPALRGRLVAVLAGLAGLGLVGAGVVFSLVFPVFALPRPIGSFRVGGVTLALPGPQGGLAVQLRYPAEAAPGPLLPYVAPPGFSGSRSRLVRTHAVAGAPVAGSERFPLLVLLPGWLGRRFENTALAEHLASLGYVVAAIDDIDLADPKPMDFSSQAAFETTIRVADSKVSREAAVAGSVLTAMLARSEHDSDGRFTARIDGGRVGVIGFSFGGAVAAEAARVDPRWRGALNMDGWLFGPVLDDWITQRFLAMSDDSPDSTEADLRSPDTATRMMAQIDAVNGTRMRRQWQLHGATLVTIAGTSHVNYSDAPFTSPLRRFTGGGPIAPARGSEIVATYAAAFFAACFGGAEDPILTAPSPRFPDVSLQLWPKQ